MSHRCTYYLQYFRQAEIEAAFHQFDRGNKGYITVQDAKTILAGIGLGAAEIESLIKFHDTNRDGILQFSEFKEFWSARGTMMGQIAVATGGTVAAPSGITVMQVAPPGAMTPRFVF